MYGAAQAPAICYARRSRVPLIPVSKETLMKIIDPTHSFYGPLWRRVAIVVVTAGWAGFEYWNGSTGWALFFAAIAAYAAWALIITYKPQQGGDGTA